MSSCDKPGSLKAALMILCSEVPILTCTKLKTITDALCSILKVGWRRVKLLSPSILFDAHFQQGFLESSWNSVACLWNIGRLVYLWRMWISDTWAPYNPIHQVPIFLCSPSTPCLVTPPMRNIRGSRLYNTRLWFNPLIFQVVFCTSYLRKSSDFYSLVCRFGTGYGWEWFLFLVVGKVWNEENTKLYV